MVSARLVIQRKVSWYVRRITLEHRIFLSSNAVNTPVAYFDVLRLQDTHCPTPIYGGHRIQSADSDGSADKSVYIGTEYEAWDK